jgi:fibro-slime domain-containing protein
MKIVSVVLAVLSLSCILVVPAYAGLTGTYYNLSNNHPDMERWVTGWTPGMVENTLSGNMPTLSAYGATQVLQWDWWTPQYEVFQRVDSTADLQGSFAYSWFPIPYTLPGDPYDFAVRWEGMFYVDADKSYTYSMGSDDDSWLFIDNSLVLDLGGVHGMTWDTYTVNLTQGWHSIDIFFAERHYSESGFQLNFFSDIVPTVPEPSVLYLFGAGLAGLAVLRKRWTR